MTTHRDEPTLQQQEDEARAELEKAERRAEAIAFNARQREERMLVALDRVVPPKFH